MRRAFLLTVAALAAACGRADSVTAPGARPEAAHDAPPPRAAPVVPFDAETALRAWNEAGEDDAARARARELFVQGGRPALLTLVRWLADAPDDDHEIAAFELLPAFGPDAYVELARSLSSARGEGRDHVAGFIRDRASAWRHDPRGGEICVAILDALTSSPDPTAISDLLYGTLSESRPAGAAVAERLGRLLTERAASDREVILDTIGALGTDGVTAAPQLVAYLRTASAEEDETRGPTLRALAAMGSAPAGILPDLVKLLEDGTGSQRRAACIVLASWGEAGASAAPALERLARCEDESVQDAALDAYVALAGAERAWPVLLDIAGGSERIRELPDPPGVSIYDLARDPAAARSMAAAFETLDSEDRAIVLTALAASQPDLGRDAAMKSLDDADAAVRATALAALARSPGSLPEARIREMATLLANGEDENARRRALEALGALPRSPQDVPVFLAALRAEATFDTAVEILAREDGPLPSVDRASADRLAAKAMEDWWGPGRPSLGVLERIQGGDDALVREVRRRLLAHDADATSDILGIALHAGARLAAVAPDLDAWMAQVELSEKQRADCVTARALFGGDVVAAAESMDSIDRDLARRLLRAGDAGRLVVIRRLGWALDGFLASLREDPAFAAAILRAAAAGPEVPEAESLRARASDFAAALPADGAGALLARLAVDPSDTVRWSACYRLRALSREGGAIVPATQLLGMLSHEDERVRGAAAVAAMFQRTPSPELAAALRERLADADAGVRACAAVALWRASRNQDESIAALRTTLVSAEIDAPWSEMGDMLAAARLRAEDRDLLVRALRAQDHVEGASALIRGLEQFGAAAEPAIPSIRAALVRSEGRGSFCGMSGPTIGDDEVNLTESAARTLVAIGPAARVAIPDLRLAVSHCGDPRGVARAAITKLEAMPK